MRRERGIFETKPKTVNVNQEPVKLIIKLKTVAILFYKQKNAYKKSYQRLYEPPPPPLLLKNFANFLRRLPGFLVLTFRLRFFSFSHPFLRKTFLLERSIMVFTKQINAINMAAADDHVC